MSSSGRGDEKLATPARAEPYRPWRCITLLALLAAPLNPAAAAEPTPQPLPRLETGMHTAMIWRIATDAAGRWAVTASPDKTARVWDVSTGKLVRVLRPLQDVGNEGKL